MDKVSDLIGRVLSKRGLKGQAQAAYVTHMTANWISEQLPDVSEQIHVRKFSDLKLEICCDHPIASQELRNKSEDLKKYLSAFDGISEPEIIISRSI